MLKKSTAALLLGVLLGLSTVSGQVREHIAIVKPKLHDDNRAFLLKIAQYFTDAGEGEIGSVFESYAEGGHGSAFVLLPGRGGVYAITNSHVVAQAETVDLSFEGTSPEPVVFGNVPVLYADDGIDIAVLKLPDDSFRTGFEWDPASRKDGQEVWSAGYPGLLNRPSWQFAKGNITNSRALVPEMVDPQVSFLLQHSASIDPGNSGGPLLVATGKDGIGYAVTGVNTWSVSGRQNTFFSLPAPAARRVLEKAREIELLKKNPAKMEADLIERCRTFAAGLSGSADDPQQRSRIISYRYVAEKGWEEFRSILSTAGSEEKKQWEEDFFLVSPVETMRRALYTGIESSAEKTTAGKGIEFIGLAEGQSFSLDNPIETRFSVDGQEKSVSWIFEHGHWRIASSDFLADAASNENDKNTSSKKLRLIGKGDHEGFWIKGSIGVHGVDLDETPTVSSAGYGPMAWGVFAGADFATNPYLSTSTAIGLYGTGGSIDDDFSGTTSDITVTYLHLSSALRLQLPIQTESYDIMPFIAGGLGFDLAVGSSESGDSSSYSSFEPTLFNLLLVVDAGAELGFGKSPDFYWGGSVTYLRHLLDDDFAGNTSDGFRFQTILLGGYIKFTY